MSIGVKAGAMSITLGKPGLKIPGGKIEENLQRNLKGDTLSLYSNSSSSKSLFTETGNY